jgi:hypothetical protein
LTGANAGGYAVNACNIGLGAGAGNIKCGLYTDAADPNKALLCQSASAAVTPNGVNTLPLAGCGTLTANTRYWVVFTTDSSAVTFLDTSATLCSGNYGDSLWTHFTYSSPLPNPWGATNVGQCDWRMFLTLAPLSVGGSSSLSAIAVSPANPSIVVGAAQQFTATGTFNDGSIKDLTASVTWNSSNTGVATISNASGTQGLATAVANGTTTITAVQSSISGSATLTVTSSSIAVKPRIASITSWQTQQFQASVTGVSWAVDSIAGGNATVGTISSTGLYTPPTTAGSHSITATGSGQTGTSTIIVQNYPGVFTWHNDNARTGQNLNELALALGNVNQQQFGQLFSVALDGAAYAQPLYVSKVTIGGTAHNVVYVATEHDSVYAFDADGSSTTPLWKVSFINPSAGITTVSTSDVSCTDGVVPEIGITGTPVIDPSSNTLFVVAATKESNGYFSRLHALDLASGKEKFGGPVVISASVTGSGDGSQGGVVSFDPLRNNQRSALLLVNGTVYIAYASHCDNTPYHGWVFGYNASNLARSSVFNTTPNGGLGGIWMSSAGPAADANGSIFLVVGNGSFDANTGGADFSDSFLKLSGTLSVLDYFTPYNQATLSANDWDVGSSGLVLLPDQSGAHPHIMVGAGKEMPATLYVVDRDSLGHFQSSDDSQIPQTIQGAFPNGLYSTGAYWNGQLYFAANNDVLKSYAISNGVISGAPVAQASEVLQYPGSTPVISANGANNGIVWILAPDASRPTAVLRAYQANNISTKIYDSEAAGLSIGSPVKFAVPTVANGKVYVGTQSQLVVFGLIP